MHYQVEVWKCAEPTIPTGSGSMTTRGKHSGAIETARQCGRLLYRRELFMVHLHDDHHLADAKYELYVKEQCKKRRVGRNGQCGFWCGFCQTVVRLEKRGIEAWDERFNHIDDEHFKKGTRVEDWVPLEGEVPRRLFFEHAPACDPEKEAREAEDKGSDEEDSGPDDEGEGEGDLVVLEAGGAEEETARAKSAAVAKTRRLSNVAGPEIREKVRRLWYCVSLFLHSPIPFPHPPFPIPFPLSNFPSPHPSAPQTLFLRIPEVRVIPPVRACSLTQQVTQQCRCGTAELSRDTDVICYGEGCNHQRCDRCRVEDVREARVPQE